MKNTMMRMAALAAVLLMALVFTAAAEPATLTVQGAGVVHVDADRVSINIGVREVAPDVVTAQAEVNRKIESVIAALKEMDCGMVSITTNGIGIYPNYSYDETETITGYNAYNNLSFTITDVNSAGACIDAAFAAGANSLDYVEFTASDTTEAADQALALAVQNAMQKAGVLAEAAGVRLGDIVSIQDNPDMGYGYGEMYAKAEDAGSGTQLLASSQAVSANVIITFAVEQGD